MKTWGIGLAGVVLLAGCSSSDAEPPAPEVQTVSDATICDLLVANDDPLSAVMDLVMSDAEPGVRERDEADRIAGELESIASRAEPEMAVKVETLASHVRDYSAWIESGFPGGTDATVDVDGFQASVFEVTNSCGV